MPYKKFKPFTRKWYRRVLGKKKKYAMRNPLRKGVTNNLRLFRATVNGYVTLSAPPNIANYDYKNTFPLNFPGTYVNNGGIYTIMTNVNVGPVRTVTIADSKTYLFQNFDQYKVQSLTLKYVPTGYWNIPALSTVNSAGFGSGCVYQKDYDDVALLPDSETALNAGTAPLTLAKPFTVVMRQLKSRNQIWYNCQSVNTLPSDNPNQNSLVPPQSFSGLKIFCENIPTANSGATAVDYLGRFYLSWDIIFKGFNMNL